MPRDDAATRAKRRKAIKGWHDAGYSNRWIGRLLKLDEKTVRWYLREITREITPAAPREITPAVSPAAEDQNVIQLRRAAQ